jgi:hypothetical protein
VLGFQGVENPDVTNLKKLLYRSVLWVVAWISHKILLYDDLAMQVIKGIKVIRYICPFPLQTGMTQEVIVYKHFSDFSAMFPFISIGYLNLWQVTRVLYFVRGYHRLP